MLHLSHHSYTTLVGSKNYSQAMYGYCSGGASDQFSYIWGNKILGNADGCYSLEMSAYLPEITFSIETSFVLTGANYQIFLDNQPIKRQQVYNAKPQQKLHFGKCLQGLRLYLAIFGGLRQINPLTYQYDANDGVVSSQKAAIHFNQLANWLDIHGAIRLTKGPEWHYLQDPQQLLDYKWTIAEKSNHLGILLEGGKIKLKNYDITSSVVNDGTLQISQSNPIILLRQRTTIGGFPRVANIIEADLDLLAQLRPKQIISFSFISLQEATKLNRLKQQVIRNL